MAIRDACKNIKSYDFIGKLLENKLDNNILELTAMDGEETIEEFDKFMNKKDKIIY